MMTWSTCLRWNRKRSFIPARPVTASDYLLSSIDPFRDLKATTAVRHDARSASSNVGEGRLNYESHIKIISFKTSPWVNQIYATHSPASWAMLSPPDSSGSTTWWSLGMPRVPTGHTGNCGVVPPVPVDEEGSVPEHLRSSLHSATTKSRNPKWIRIVNIVII
ncbi:hypothetical protein B296_00045305 [Ensete ventricosum]|uniref:Uncharacterized protein n=1 Tax=Ensete ventricosum TaxID=4639 RepID=A0A426Z3L8_ENSVE|nr:hypothetical protein B296_00045305 [Ensete ventricosum]